MKEVIKKITELYAQYINGLKIISLRERDEISQVLLKHSQKSKEPKL